CGVVSAELLDRATDCRVEQRVDERSCGGEGVPGQRQVVPLPDQWDEVEIECGGGGSYSHADSCDPGGDGQSDLEMGRGLGAGHRVRWYLGLLEHAVEQDARSRAEFAFGHANVAQITQAGDIPGIARRDE